MVGRRCLTCWTCSARRGSKGADANLYDSPVRLSSRPLTCRPYHIKTMLSQSFYLLGEAPASARTIQADENASLDDLKDLVASHFAIVVADGE
jgi:hypothetical protein